MKWIGILLSVITSDFVCGKYLPQTPNVLFFDSGRGFAVKINNEGITDFEVRYINTGKSNNWLIDGSILKPYGLNEISFLNFEEEFKIGDLLIYSIQLSHEHIPQKVQYHFKNVTEFKSAEDLGFSAYKVKLEFLTPGFKINFESYDSIMNIYIQINSQINNKMSADAVVTGIKLNRYGYINNQFWFKRGDKLCIWIDFVAETGITFEFVQHIASYNGNLNCFIGVTTFGDKDKICMDSIIFEDNFDKHLDLLVWTFERKFGAEPDFEFVLYSNLSAEIRDAMLQITPQEFFNDDPKYEILDCTGVPNSPECVFDRQRNIDVFPPILTSRLTTKNSFSFKYGRVEVRAKLPTADWTVPFIMIEPKESKCQGSSYKSGPIHIVSLANNPTINSTVKQGPQLGAKEPYRTTFMTKRSFDSEWYSEFHTFAVEWRPDGITTFIDDERQFVKYWRYTNLNIPGSDAWKNSDVAVAPFDQEFYISVGVSVGGINDFQSGTPWDLTSPMQRRQFQNSPEWRSSRKYGKNTLKVDYVKVLSVSN